MAAAADVGDDPRGVDVRILGSDSGYLAFKQNDTNESKEMADLFFTTFRDTHPPPDVAMRLARARIINITASLEHNRRGAEQQLAADPRAHMTQLGESILSRDRKNLEFFQALVDGRIGDAERLLGEVKLALDTVMLRLREASPGELSRQVHTTNRKQQGQFRMCMVCRSVHKREGVVEWDMTLHDCGKEGCVPPQDLCMKCAKCKVASYCSVAHQRYDWKTKHKHECLEWTNMRKDEKTKRVGRPAANHQR
jgi:hypothetical protein